MHLLLVLILGFMLIPKGYAMKCYNGTCKQEPCKTQVDCPGMKCAAATVMYTPGGKNMTMKSCGDKMCVNGSMNFGSRRAYAMCCDGALCNSESPAIPMTTNDMKCYTCSGNNCSIELSCSGAEDRCMSGYAETNGKPMKVMGCAQASMCRSNIIDIGVMRVSKATCCEGNMCNGGRSIAVSLLLLVAPVVSVALFN